MTDLEILDEYCEKCQDYVHPLIFRDVLERGLTRYINFLPNGVEQSKAVVRARLAAEGKYFDDPEINDIAGKIRRLNHLEGKLHQANLADVHKTLPILTEMLELSREVENYYKQ